MSMTFADRLYDIMKEDAFEKSVDNYGNLNQKYFESEMDRIKDDKLNQLHAENEELKKRIKTLAENISIREEAAIRSELDSLIRSGVLIINKKESVIVQDRTANGFSLRVVPRVTIEINNEK